jgi:hypothetical protein
MQANQLKSFLTKNNKGLEISKNNELVKQIYEKAEEMKRIDKCVDCF